MTRTRHLLEGSGRPRTRTSPGILLDLNGLRTARARGEGPSDTQPYQTEERNITESHSNTADSASPSLNPEGPAASSPCARGTPAENHAKAGHPTLLSLRTWDASSPPPHLDTHPFASRTARWGNAGEVNGSCGRMERRRKGKNRWNGAGYRTKAFKRSSRSILRAASKDTPGRGGDLRTHGGPLY